MNNNEKMEVSKAEKSLANANLIAAAPELLEACKLALDALEYYTEYDTIAKLKLKEVIQQAEGGD